MNSFYLSYFSPSCKISNFVLCGLFQVVTFGLSTEYSFCSPIVLID